MLDLEGENEALTLKNRLDTFTTKRPPQMETQRLHSDAEDNTDKRKYTTPPRTVKQLILGTKLNAPPRRNVLIINVMFSVSFKNNLIRSLPSLIKTSSH